MFYIVVQMLVSRDYLKTLRKKFYSINIKVNHEWVVDMFYIVVQMLFCQINIKVNHRRGVDTFYVAVRTLQSNIKVLSCKC